MQHSLQSLCGVVNFFLSTRVDLCFVVHKLEIFSSDTVRVHFEGLVNLLRYIRDNNNLGLKYYSNIDYLPLYELLIQARIKTENQFMVFYDLRWRDLPDTGRSTVSCFLFCQGVTIMHCTYAPGLIYQYGDLSEYNSA